MKYRRRLTKRFAQAALAAGFLGFLIGADNSETAHAPHAANSSDELVAVLSPIPAAAPFNADQRLGDAVGGFLALYIAFRHVRRRKPI